MDKDIMLIDNTRGMNNKTAVCSTTVTGESAKRIIRANFPINLTIDNVESKYNHRFDDPGYYYGCCGTSTSSEGIDGGEL